MDVGPEAPIGLLRHAGSPDIKSLDYQDYS